MVDFGRDVCTGGVPAGVLRVGRRYRLETVASYAGQVDRERRNVAARSWPVPRGKQGGGVLTEEQQF